MEVINTKPSDHQFWNAVVSFCGIAYFVAWSYSFYPQLILNFKRKRTTGLSPDFIYLNPLGFLALTIWSWGAYFSPIAREQYQERHGEGHFPEISKSDLAFSLHAFLISSITLGQVWWYARLNRAKKSDIYGREEDPLLSPAGISALLVWSGKYQFLDWLYLDSSIKLIISAVKYVPQVVLNWKLRSVEGFAIGQIICDLIGSVLSFAQLVISSTIINNDPSGIIANPAKLGLSFLSLTFDLVFIFQKYWLFRDVGKEEEGLGGAGDEED
uniref:Cystinosin n=1 Tax=Kwoniella bestiolae CBS 10118 TaxID=1296100 RepID=A0A1B9G260_9TREE|nr:hypothetical protein I302_04916 [Kwoniella bestiolae CBS 10118]OCF25106.1 hypothetical protein I302_04916 [Kwoniella bestiolae CBS 10118]